MSQRNLKRQRDDKNGEVRQMLPECAVYYPEELALFGTILDQVMESLPENLQTPANRAALASNIMACASTGERDPDELSRAALIDSKIRTAA